MSKEERSKRKRYQAERRAKRAEHRAKKREQQKHDNVEKQQKAQLTEPKASKATTDFESNRAHQKGIETAVYHKGSNFHPRSRPPRTNREKREYREALRGKK